MDGRETGRKVCTVIINNGRYGGGGMLTAPGADLSDGLLDALIIGNLSKPDLLWSLPRIYKGTHLSHPKVTIEQTREVEISSAHPLYLQADGELLGMAPARFGILPSALNIVA
jgi:diacylglycerol kinase family enzyme